MPSYTGSALQRFVQKFQPVQRSALIPSIDQVMQMQSWYLASQNMVPTTTMNNKVEPIGSGFRELSAGAYASNPIVFACMQARVQLFSQARFQFQRMKNGVPGELFGTPASYLRLLETPWPGGTTAQLLSEMLTDADLGGNAFVARRQDQLQRLRPDWTVIIAGSPNSDATTWDLDTKVLGYGYQPDGPAGGKKWELLQPEEVAHFRPVPDPLRRFAGMSWLVPVIREIMADSTATSHKLKFFENAATPNMAVKFDATMTRAQAEDWIKLFHTSHEGARNAYKTLFLGGGSDMYQVGANLQEADFTKVQGGGELRIASAAGVPPIIVGLSGGLEAATYSNYGQARRAFADLTERPLWGGVCGALQAITQVPAESRLWFDAADISFLQEDQKDEADIQAVQATAIRSLLDGGFEADAVLDAVIANDFARLQGKHTGLFSVQLQAPGSTKMPAGEVPGEVPVDGGTKPESVTPVAKPPTPLLNSTSANGFGSVEIRCGNCGRLVGKRTAPGGSFEVKCRGCATLVAA